MKRSIKTIDAHDKVAIYVRVSTQWQIDKDSLPMQRNDLSNYCKYVLNINDYEIFEDAGYSAKNTDRPDYQEMMSRIRTGEFSHLLVWKIDRISRNLQDFLSMYEELKKLGVVFVSRNEQFDTSTAMGEAMLKIILVFAELERNTTSERVTDVMVSRATGGKWNGGRIPYGYKFTGKGQNPEIDEKEAAVVRLIYNRYETTRSLLHTAKSINEKGIKTKRGNEWSAQTIWKILRNPWYIGSYVYNKRNESKSYELNDESEWIIIQNHHEPIISKDQFDRVQVTIQGNTRDKTRSSITRTNKNIHIFAGLLSCGCCGENMSATVDRPRKDGTRPSIYACYGKRKASSCSNKYISDIVLLPFVINYIRFLMRAKDESGHIKSEAQLKKIMLSSKVFSDVENIEGLDKTIRLLHSGVSGVEYISPELREVKEPSTKLAKEYLEDEYRKNLRALSRLKSLYLYSDNEMDKADYIAEKDRLENLIKEQEIKLSQSHPDIQDGIKDNEELVQKANYVLMLRILQGDDSLIESSRLFKVLDPAMAKSFINTIIDGITVLDGRVIEIRLKNGISHKFTYKKK